MIKTLRKATLALAAISALPAAAAGWQQFTNPDGSPWTEAQYVEFSDSVSKQTATNANDLQEEAEIEGVQLVTRNNETYAYIEIDAGGLWNVQYKGTTIRTAGGLSYGTFVESADWDGVDFGMKVDGWKVTTISPNGTPTGWLSDAHRGCQSSSACNPMVFNVDELIQEGRVAYTANVARAMHYSKELKVEGEDLFQKDPLDGVQNMGTLGLHLRNAGVDHITLGYKPTAELNEYISFVPNHWKNVNGPTYVAAYFRSQ
ncbi:hypothetical protein [Aliivibrio fischeri]|uniref:hypothetical protein n=1 Tax=Aliivibrio fischeri TaxID=668 RepID=UPI0006D1F223|nr:hypothetical protein [Aliivibrio fischeri]USR97597.1 hypothetical protein AVFI_14045 [Aliivibrio fischeri ATCC 7744 = JCM 18803 = DSM 507]GGK50709.1 hypothetical protein GCM10007987_37210 [Aliivibrio fischeri]